MTIPRSLTATPPPRPLRILAVAASPRDLPPLELSRERDHLENAVGKASGIEIFDANAATLAALREGLLSRECHVLHFMGHGGATVGQQERVLFFETADGLSHPVTGTDLVNKPESRALLF